MLILILKSPTPPGGAISGLSSTGWIPTKTLLNIPELKVTPSWNPLVFNGVDLPTGKHQVL